MSQDWPATTDIEADRIAARTTTFNHPAPDRPGYRMVGWYVPENVIGLGTTLLALDKIALAWRNWREIGTRPL